MKKIIEKTQEGYVLHSTDGTRLVSRGADHALYGTMTHTPTVGDIVTRALTKAETAEYAALRRKEKNIFKVGKLAKAAAEKKAEEKAARRASWMADKAAKKAENQAAETERAELREIARELKKLEAEEPKAEEAKAEKKPVVGHVKKDYTNVKISYWEIKALEEQRKLDLQKPVIDMVTEKEQTEKEEFARWMNGLCKVRSFVNADKVYETNRRRIENANASSQLGHPAMAAAAVFSNGLMAASALLGVNAGELGGKNILLGIDKRRDVIADLDAQLDDLRDEYIASMARQDELHDQVKNCIKFEAWGDMDALKLCYEQLKGYNQTLNDKRRRLHKQKNLLVAELKVLKSGLKELLDNTEGTQRALVEAQIEAAKIRRKDKKERLAGRPVIPCGKPMLKGYKTMYFPGEAWKKTFAKLIDGINAAANKCFDVVGNDEYTDSEQRAVEKELFDKVTAAIKWAKAYKENGGKLKLDAADAKIHNARQSYLTDLINVPYGQTTDMVITVTHNVANIFSNKIEEFLLDYGATEDLMAELMQIFMDVVTANGIEVTMLPNSKGLKRVTNYKFWNANNSQLKVGKFIALEEKAYEVAKEVGQCGMSDEEFEEIQTNGPDMLKHQSYATTPGAPLMYGDKPLDINDVLVVKSIDTIRKFKNVLMFKDDGSKELKDIAELERTAFDGEIFLMVPIPSQQMRGGFCFKGFGVCCAYEDGTTIVDEIAKREGWQIPEMIEDVDGIKRRWRDYKAICTEDAWKWAGWKFGESGRKFTYEEYRTRMNKLAEKYPTANMLYTARIADATEESKRRLTRQSMQQFLTATDEDIQKLYERSVRKILKLNTHAGILRMMAGLDKPEEERTAFEHLVEAYPELLDSDLMKRVVEDTFNRKVAEAAVRPEVDGIYPYIAEDPVAFFKIILWKKNPNQMGLGYLKSNQVNIPNAEEGKTMYVVRYPNNFLCGQIKQNHNDDIYRCVGNVMILSLDGGILIWLDGDCDGDEACVIFDEVVYDLMHRAKIELKPPMVSFPHSKMPKSILRGKEARAAAISKAIITANEFGPAVGKNSNLATKIFNRASNLYYEWKKTGQDKWKIQAELQKAIVAHVAAIIAIDLAKTGEMPAWLDLLLVDIVKFAGRLMPWNQRFCKDSKVTPWFENEYWDDETRPESMSVVDRGARYVIDKTNAVGYHAPTGNEFVLDELLGPKDGLWTAGTSAKLTVKEFRKLEARNYRTKGTNSEGDDEFKLIQDMKSKDENVFVGPTELFRFLWRNQASLVYVLQQQQTDNDKLDNAAMQNAYYDFCRELMLNFGSYCPKDTRFLNRSKELQQKSNVYKLVKMAFSDKNGIGKRASTPEEAESKKASICVFAVKVFAWDLYQIQCDRLGIENRWTKPEVSTATDNADAGYQESSACNIGYCDYEDEVA